MNCEGKRVLIDEDEHLMLSSGLSNPTPWNTPREVPDEELAHIEGLVAGISDLSRTIFNFHAPPKDSSLDTAAEPTGRPTRRRSSRLAARRSWPAPAAPPCAPP